MSVHEAAAFFPMLHGNWRKSEFFGKTLRIRKFSKLTKEDEKTTKDYYQVALPLPMSKDKDFFSFFSFQLKNDKKKTKKKSTIEYCQVALPLNLAMPAKSFPPLLLCLVQSAAVTIFTMLLNYTYRVSQKSSFNTQFPTFFKTI